MAIMNTTVKLLAVFIVAACFWHGLDAAKVTTARPAVRSGESPAVRSIVNLLKRGDVKNAEKEIKALTTRNDVIEEIMRKAYKESAKLSDLALFSCWTGFYMTGYLAKKTLIAEMEKNRQMQDYSIITLYHKMVFDAQQENFKKQNASLRNDIDTLRGKVSTHANTITNSLVDDIAKEEFQRPLTALNATKEIHLSEDFLGEIYKRYLAKSGAPFKNIMAYTIKLQFINDKCHVASVMMQQMRSTFKGNGFEALQVWLYAKDKVEFSQFYELKAPSWAKCKAIADSVAPTHKDELIREYSDTLRNNRSVEKFRVWHKDYFGMRILLRDVIEDLPKEQLQGQNLNNLIVAIESMKILNIRCWAGEALRKKMERFGLLRTPAHERMLLMVKKTMEDGNYSAVTRFSAEKCTNAKRP